MEKIRILIADNNDFDARNLKDYLERAGAIITNNSELADINLSINNLNKDSLINLFL